MQDAGLTYGRNPGLVQGTNLDDPIITRASQATLWIVAAAWIKVWIEGRFKIESGDGLVSFDPIKVLPEILGGLRI